jgi:hypothetical protein
MKLSLAITLVLCWFGLAGCLDSHADEAAGGLIDQVCQSADDCAAPAAECINYAGAERCFSECTESTECGPRAECVNQECWRSCDSVADCEGSDWDCRSLSTSSGPGTGGICVPPCSLFACSIDGFSYSCGTGSYSSSTSISYVGQTTVTTEVTYSNGHTVQCSGTASSGDCSDDSGASCQW